MKELFSGGAGILVGHPLDTVKTRLQTIQGYTGMLDCMKKTVRQESLFGLYKGMFMPVMSAGVIHSLLFAGYGIALRQLHKNESNVEARKDLPMLEILFASTCGTLLQVAPVVPIELVKTKLQVQRENVSHFVAHSKNLYAGPWECIRDTVRHEGVKGLFKGGSVVLSRDVISYMFYIPVYEGVLRTFRKYDLEGTAAHLLAGGIAGVFAWITVCPLEVLKCRIQSDKSHLPIKASALAKEIYRAEGMKAFFRGAVALCIRGFVVNAAIFVVYEKTVHHVSKL
ncbi:unnamed protein product [Caenorhabditis auriculariae]|uniref:Mitochondrial carrier protein n=1 Tax=Caenorhabditis auriculariae TaxID=2777116 RepID=A0A8S1HA05_9PELO|nr:unnamed protein product [Caenorhabditis auriculariae]